MTRARTRALPRPVASAALLLAATAFTSAPPAYADPADKAAAESLFVEGKSLLDAGKAKEACPKLEESMRLEQATGTLINLARCHEAIGKIATAWAEYKEVAVRSEREGNAARARGATELAAKLEGRVPHMSVAVTKPVAGMSVERDGRAVGEGSYGAFVAVDPGEHVVVAKAPGHREWSERVNVTGDAARVTVTVPALEEAAAPAPGGEGNTSGATSGGTAPSSRSSSNRTLGFALGGAGVAGVAIGTVFGILTLAKASDVKDDPALCKGGCTPAGREAADTATVFGVVSTIGFGLGVAGLGAGAVLLLTSGGESSSTGLVVAPVVGKSSGGLALARKF